MPFCVATAHGRSFLQRPSWEAHAYTSLCVAGPLSRDERRRARSADRQRAAAQTLGAATRLRSQLSAARRDAAGASRASRDALRDGADAVPLDFLFGARLSAKTAEWAGQRKGGARILARLKQI